MLKQENDNLDNFVTPWNLWLLFRGGSRTAATSKMSL